MEVDSLRFLVGIILLIPSIWIVHSLITYDKRDPMRIVTDDMSEEEKEFTRQVSQQMAEARAGGVIMLRPPFNSPEPLIPMR